MNEVPQLLANLSRQAYPTFHSNNTKFHVRNKLSLCSYQKLNTPNVSGKIDYLGNTVITELLKV